MDYFVPGSFLIVEFDESQHFTPPRAVLFEEFDDRDDRRAVRNVVRHRAAAGWNEYELHQRFSRLADPPPGGIEAFVTNDLPKRIAGNCCILLCGETNGVPHSKAEMRVVDRYGLRAAIPDRVRVIINPIHDRMTRYEMPLKRQFLSERGRWVVSVWNKGKADKNGRVKDGARPPWTVFYNGTRVDAEGVPNGLGVDIGVVDTGVRHEGGATSWLRERASGAVDRRQLHRSMRQTGRLDREEPELAARIQNPCGPEGASDMLGRT